MAIASSDVSFYLLHKGYSSLKASPELAVEGMPTDSQSRIVTMEGGRICRAYFWTEPTKEVPAFTGLIQAHFDPTYSPPLAEKASAIIFIEVAVLDPYDPTINHRRIIALTFGNGHNRLRQSAYQLQFGKALLLNVARATNLDLVKKNIPGSRGKVLLEQLHATGSIYDFTQVSDIFDVAKVGARTAFLNDRSAQGADQLRIRCKMSLSDLCDDADSLLLAFLSSRDRDKELDDLEYLTVLEKPVDQFEIRQKCYESLANPFIGELSVGTGPECEGLERIVLKHKYSGNARYKSEILIDEWSAEILLKVIKVSCNSFDEFDSLKVFVQVPDEKGQAFVDKGNGKYMTHYLSYVSAANSADQNFPVPYRNVLSEGRYLRCPATLHDRLAQRISSVPFELSGLLPDFDRLLDRDSQNRPSEGAYNLRAAADLGWYHLDRNALRALVAGSRVEFCDLFNNGDLYCVKRSIESDAVAKVCNQAMDAAITLENYVDSWQKICSIAGITFPYDPKISRDKFSFVIVLIETQDKHNRDKLNLKSKLSIARARGDIQQRGYGFRVEFVTDPG